MADKVFIWFNPDMGNATVMINWCRNNTAEHVFTRNSLTAISGVWLKSEDALAFRLRFGV